MVGGDESLERDARLSEYVDLFQSISPPWGGYLHRRSLPLSSRTAGGGDRNYHFAGPAGCDQLYRGGSPLSSAPTWAPASRHSSPVSAPASRLGGRLRHISFNLFGVALTLLLLKPFTWIVMHTASTIPPRQIANAHTLFNVFTAAIVMLFF